MNYQAILDVVRTLPMVDQARLAIQIRDDLIAQSEDDDLPPELKEDLDRRLADIEANPDDFIPWEVVLADAQARHKK